jgi:hypothetical protein
MVVPRGKAPVAVVRRLLKLGIKIGSFYLIIMVLIDTTLGRTALLFFALLGSVWAAPDYSGYARLLDAYVSEGGVDYNTWAGNANDVAALDQFLGEMSAVKIADLSPSEQKAFYINLYNAGMLQAVFRNYPLKSVKQIGFLPFSIFKKNFIRLGDRKLSLDTIEKEILLKDYFDPRIHFAVNCASESCPPLRAEPYCGPHLDAQLDEQTRLFAESPRAARVDSQRKRIAFSELFKWYADDFGVENPAAFLNRYRKVLLPLDYAKDWIDYDWSLNSLNEN